MKLLCTTPATSEPVTSTEAKAHLRVDHANDDTYIGTLITAAREYVEAHTRRQLMPATWTLCLESFPNGEIELPYPPLVSITSVKYIPAGGTLTTLSASNYQVDTYSLPGRIAPAYGYVWPSVRGGDWNGVQIVYAAGYAAAANVPTSIKQAILLIVGHLYENREPEITGLSISRFQLAVDALLMPHRGQWL